MQGKNLVQECCVGEAPVKAFAGRQLLSVIVMIARRNLWERADGLVLQSQFEITTKTAGVFGPN